MTDSTDNARGPDRITAEKLDELWEEFEISAKPTSFDGDMEFFNVEDMQDQAYYLYEAAKSLLAPDPLRSVKVKPLVWKAHNEIGHGRAHYGSGAFDHWYAVSRAGRDTWDCMTFIGGKRRGLGEHSTLAAAKAAAQADYEARIRSALEPCDPLADPRVVATVEALKDWLELAEHCSIADGVCCCGEKMENHSALIDCGHLPVDHATYVARRLTESTRAALATLSPTGGNADE